jgi:hypothetical protein
MSRWVLGVDPGQLTGCAVFEGGALVSLDTYSPAGFIRYLEAVDDVLLLSIEDSRMQQAVFSSQGHGQAKALKIARDVGRIDGLCAIVQGICEDRGIQFVQISPKTKGAKLSHADFLLRVPGWAGQTNSHVRDAYAVGFMFRHYRPRGLVDGKG